MKAAVVDAFDLPPRYAEFPEPTPVLDEVLASVKAAALTQLVRAQASGKHYSAGKPPFVPGADGVGLVEGRRMYFAFPRPPSGSMAERVAVKRTLCTPIPDALDDVTAAAAANPGMAAWAGLTRRARFVRGEAVLVNGATGVSGRVAIQVAKYLGARRVVVTARNPASESELRALGADAFICLTLAQAELVDAFRAELGDHGIDVVLDFLYGNSAEAFVHACVGAAQGKAEPRVRFVQIGTLAGPNITLPGAVLRSSGLELLGSGLGALSHEELVTCIGEFFQSYGPAKVRVATEAAPLADVAEAWTRKTGARLVLTV
jgi:NADPH:quinone reductase-like Zn-dependent oxidoreductase